MWRLWLVQNDWKYTKASFSPISMYSFTLQVPQASRSSKLVIFVQRTTTDIQIDALPLAHARWVISDSGHMLPNSAFNEAVLEPTLACATFSKHQCYSLMVRWWWLSIFKVKRGNSDTNFDLLGLLPPKTDNIHNACSVRYSSHLLSSMAPTIVTKHTAPRCRRWKWLPWWGNSDNGTPQHAFAHLFHHGTHIQGWREWYLAAYTMFMVWKCKWRYFSGPFYELSIMKFYSCIAYLMVS